MDTHPDELDLTETEADALHELQLGIEYVHRAYGQLLQFHHGLGHAMDRMNDAEDDLREAGHDDWANLLRDDLLPAGAIDDQWTFELVEAFSDGFFEDVTEFERDVRGELADGTGHVTERRQKLQTLERAED
jgi:hypothetical protein